MPYTIEEARTISQPAAAVYQAAVGAIGGLDGQILRQDPAAGQIEARFDKKIHGKVLGDRTQLQVMISESPDGASQLALTAYPIDAVGRKLMFGARKGVTQTVVGWFFAHLDHRLKAE